MKRLFLSAVLIAITHKAWSTGDISPNHQVNPPHSFKRLVCSEAATRGASGYTIVINAPNGQDAEAQVFFNRQSEPRILVATWPVKYIIAPGIYSTFTNQFQKMDISRGFEDRFHLSLQLHSGNGVRGVYEAIFQSPSLLGYEIQKSYETRLNQKSLQCKFQ